MCINLLCYTVGQAGGRLGSVVTTLKDIVVSTTSQNLYDTFSRVFSGPLFYLQNEHLTVVF